MQKKNSQILDIFETLIKVDRNSPDMDFALKFKNKANFKALKEKSQDIQESLQAIYEKFGKQETRNGVVVYNFKYTDQEGKEVNNTAEANLEIKKIYDIETDIAIAPVKVSFVKDPATGKANTLGMNITAQEMDMLEDVFSFEYSD